ncbi:hypothetical protein F4819DRAFT_509496 [Hypoxylon fuscum]|nr:hypothetical protein F4819DRAFT_509496 [Hypoxylon fuscum]
MTRNIRNTAGLVNGAKGTIYDVSWEEGSDIEEHPPQVIMVAFDNYTGPPFHICPSAGTPIPPTSREAESARSNVLVNDPPAPLQGLQSLIFHGVSPKVFREERPMFCVSFVTGSWEEDVTLGDGTQKPQPIWTEVLRRRDTRDHAHATVAIGARIKEGAPVSAMFMVRYLRGTGQVDWTAEHVAKIVELGLWETKGEIFGITSNYYDQM